MMKIASLAASIVLLCASLNNTAFAVISMPCEGTTTNPCIVQDTNSIDNKEVKHLRDADMIADTYQGNTHGLKHKWISASAAPSVADLAAIAKFVSKESHHQATKIVDLDLRQEDHGYLNNEAITLADHYNWINLGKSDAQAIFDEMDWLNSLDTNKSQQAYVLAADDFKAGHYDKGYVFNINTIASEKEVAEAAGFDYVRLTITDHMSPLDADVDKFVSMVRMLTPTTWLHLHCRGGDGRSTTFFAMYDMLYNADVVSFDDIIKRQASVKPYYDLFDIDNKDPVITPYYKQRLIFLKQFYLYASDALRGYTGNWSAWKQENAARIQQITI